MHPIRPRGLPASRASAPRRLARALPLLIVLAAVSCSAPGRHEPAGTDHGTSAVGADAVVVVEGERSGTSRDGSFVVRWTPDPDPLPFNAPFSVIIEVARAETPDRLSAEVDILVGAFMPDHGHGMNRLPRLTRVGDGRFRVDGMLFHMPGYWELVVSIYAGTESDQAVLPIVLE